MAANSRGSIGPVQSRGKPVDCKAAMHGVHGKKKAPSTTGWSLMMGRSLIKVVAETREEGFVIRRLDSSQGGGLAFVRCRGEQ